MWIKICGIQDVDTATRVAALGADAVGLNFYQPSPRFVERDVAREIAAALPRSVESIGVFVNASADFVSETCRECNLRGLQFHGDEPAQYLADVIRREPGLKVIRAFRLGSKGFTPFIEYLDECRHRGVILDACLIDSHVEGEYGGTGQQAAWDVVASHYRRKVWPSLVLAGGLKADNVRSAIDLVQPWGVDVASGVETAPGEKDLAQVEAFIQAARGR